MANLVPVITGFGVVSSVGSGKEVFWQNLIKGKRGFGSGNSFFSDGNCAIAAAEIKKFAPEQILGPKGLRNLDRSTLLALTAAHFCINDAHLCLNKKNSNAVGISLGTSFSHLNPIFEFDKEVAKEGVTHANPALFPATVINAPASYVAIRYGIKSFSVTLNTGFSSTIESLKYSINALRTGSAKWVLAGAVESLSYPLLFGLHALRYHSRSGNNNDVLRSRGPVPAEAGVMFCLENNATAKKRKASVYGRIRGIGVYFEPEPMAGIKRNGIGLQQAIQAALKEAAITDNREIDCIVVSANGSSPLDMAERRALENVFGSDLVSIPASAVKSLTGESYAAAGALNIGAAIGIFLHGMIPASGLYRKESVAALHSLKVLRKKVSTVLVTAMGPGGYHGACVIERGDK